MIATYIRDDVYYAVYDRTGAPTNEIILPRRVLISEAICLMALEALEQPSS